MWYPIHCHGSDVVSKLLDSRKNHTLLLLYNDLN